MRNDLAYYLGYMFSREKMRAVSAHLAFHRLRIRKTQVAYRAFCDVCDEGNGWHLGGYFVMTCLGSLRIISSRPPFDGDLARAADALVEAAWRMHGNRRHRQTVLCPVQN